MDDTPSFWMVEPDTTTTDKDITLYITLPMQPELGWYMVFKTHYAQRRFIVSSPLRDAITGSDP
ncbi:hypothetical protein FRC11_014140, partial [Ceratobasidium sp. 423]